MIAPGLPQPKTRDSPTPASSGRGVPRETAGPAHWGDSRVAHVDPRGDLVAGLAREAIAAAAVREEVVEILHRELERARHGGGGAQHARQEQARRRAAGQLGGGSRREPPSPAPGAGPPGSGSCGARAP